MDNSEINEKLNKIIIKLENIERKLNIVEESCNGMDNHINFVHGVYSVVRSPLDFIVNQVGKLNGQRTTLALPEK